jgi:hypothetical protein
MRAMNIQTLLHYFVEANRHVAEAKMRIQRQRSRISKLSGDGHDTDVALELLGLMRESLQLHFQHREKILFKLSKLGWVPRTE